MKKKFEDMKIGGKLVAAFAIIIFLYIVTIITVIANINSMNERTQLLYDEPFANVESSLWMIANLQSVGKNVTLLISTEDVVDEEEYLEKTSQNVAEIEKQLKQLTTGYISGAEKVSELEVQYEELNVIRTVSYTHLDILSVVPDTDWNCVSIGGQIYGVPNNKDKAEGFGLAMRTDMLEASGYDISSIKTEKDLEGLFAAVKEKYPDSYPLVSDNGGMGYYNITRDDLGGDFGWLENCLDDSEMTVVDWFETDTFKEIVQRRYDWAQMGYIMPDAATNTQNAYELMAAGKGFSYFYNTKPGIEAEWSRKVGKDITVVELVETYRTSASGMNTWYIAHNSEKPERAMQVLNEIYSNPDLSNILINGIEGENFLIDSERGVLTYPEGVDASNTTYSSVAWVWPNELITIPWEVDGADIWKQTEEFNNNAKLSKAFGFVWDNSDVLNEITACNNVTAKYKNALDCGSLNPEEAVPKMVQELKDAGIDTIIAEKQAQLDAWAAQQ